MAVLCLARGVKVVDYAIDRLARDERKIALALLLADVEGEGIFFVFMVG